MTEPAHLTDVRLRDRTLVLAFQAAGDDRQSIRLPLSPGHLQAVKCLCWLHGHQPGCAARMDVHVGLLLRCVSALGGPTPTVIIQTGPPPRFHLRLASPGGIRQLPLGLLDAVCLVVSGRLPIRLTGPPGDDWDRALRRLLDSEDGPGDTSV